MGQWCAKGGLAILPIWLFSRKAMHGRRCSCPRYSCDAIRSAASRRYRWHLRCQRFNPAHCQREQAIDAPDLLSVRGQASYPSKALLSAMTLQGVITPCSSLAEPASAPVGAGSKSGTGCVLGITSDHLAWKGICRRSHPRCIHCLAGRAFRANSCDVGLQDKAPTWGSQIVG